jgi:hypothetical protein
MSTQIEMRIESALTTEFAHDGTTVAFGSASANAIAGPSFGAQSFTTTP